MGRGSSKVGGGGSNSAAGGGKSNSGVAIKDIENATLRQTLADIVNDSMMGRNYGNSRSQKDGNAIDKNTSVGDVLDHGTVSYQKVGNNSWAETSDLSNTFTSDGMARIIAGLSYFSGSWKYIKK